MYTWQISNVSSRVKGVAYYTQVTCLLANLAQRWTQAAAYSVSCPRIYSSVKRSVWRDSAQAEPGERVSEGELKSLWFASLSSCNDG